MRNTGSYIIKVEVFGAFYKAVTFKLRLIVRFGA